MGKGYKSSEEERERERENSEQGMELVKRDKREEINRKKES